MFDHLSLERSFDHLSLERSFCFFQRAAFVIGHLAHSIVLFHTAFFLLSFIFILLLLAKNLFHSDS